MIRGIVRISFKCLNIRFSRRFPYIYGPSFSPYKRLQNVHFSNVGNMHFCFTDCTYILTRTQGEKFEEMFLVKIVSKGTSLRIIRIICSLARSLCKSTDKIWPQIKIRYWSVELKKSGHKDNSEYAVTIGA